MAVAITTIFRGAIERDPASGVEIAKLMTNSGFRDPEGVYMMARCAARLDQVDTALQMFELVISRGFHCAATMRRDPWLAALRGRPEFEVLIERAEAGHREAARVFREVGGEALLGVEAE